MAYVLYTSVFILLIISSILIFTRHHWLPHLPHLPFITPSSPSYQTLPTFNTDISSGLSSTTFDLTTNLASADPRAGLDTQAKTEIKKIMKSQKVGFDEARKLYVERRFGENGIAPDGRPRDPKFVSFS
ncbi:hypothetical protein M430DRAFT_53108 [Amorphotheca resinae ATCC 22711]|uniref:Uncharacterized protein n=1 Tax=Amorphotheca resinae ATCC 22711 TaxID=857342 RepID=A0A2T3ASS3_AMORE|nr:hypothetical protein M430DRAFT_53108 [Amorphotheca resinae ATCC 22711]PSS10544.1 hypothetical protein M430DRAFT_53108 [Amorphotheca resinae ATCC 22711]